MVKQMVGLALRNRSRQEKGAFQNPCSAVGTECIIKAKLPSWKREWWHNGIPSYILRMHGTRFASFVKCIPICEAIMRCIGFHGTEKKDALNIVDKGFRDPEKVKGVGKGIYFFEATGLTEGEPEAFDFAVRVDKCIQPSVIRALIESNDILDLVKDKIARGLFDSCKTRALQLWVANKKNLKDFGDHIVFLMIDDTRMPDVVRCLIDGTREHRYSSFVVRRPQMILCVKNKMCIKDTVISK